MDNWVSSMRFPVPPSGTFSDIPNIPTPLTLMNIANNWYNCQNSKYTIVPTGIEIVYVSNNRTSRVTKLPYIVANISYDVYFKGSIEKFTTRLREFTFIYDSLSYNWKVIGVRP